jgi:hypothetical protein
LRRPSVHSSQAPCGANSLVFSTTEVFRAYWDGRKACRLGGLVHPMTMLHPPAVALLQTGAPKAASAATRGAGALHWLAARRRSARAVEQCCFLAPTAPHAGASAPRPAAAGCRRRPAAARTPPRSVTSNAVMLLSAIFIDPRAYVLETHDSIEGAAVACPPLAVHHDLYISAPGRRGTGMSDFAAVSVIGIWPKGQRALACAAQPVALVAEMQLRAP